MNSVHVANAARGVPKPPLNRNQIRGFWAAWGGWALDGLNSFIYALVLVPALKELLPRSGIAASAGNIGLYGGLLFALFLIGWGLSLVWGPIADRFGRVRTLCLTILFFCVFAILSGLAINVWQLAIFRLLSGVGIGGEWSMGGTLIAEEWPEERRKMGAGLMHTGYYFGIFLAGIANYFVAYQYGWRMLFILGGVPAVFIAFVYYGVHEPSRWKEKQNSTSERWSARRAFLYLFSPEYRTKTLLNSTYMLVSIIGLWAGSVYVPASITYLAANAGYSLAQGARLASYGTLLLAVGTIIGCLILPPLAEAWGRRITMALYFFLMLVFIAVGFGYVFYLKQNALLWFMLCLFLLGVGGANFAMYTMWVPEQYRTECRASAFAFSTSVGRFVGAGVTFLVGAGVQHFKTIGIPVALTAIAFVIGLALLPFGEETKGKPLPA
jgi:MFS family permease